MKLLAAQLEHVGRFNDPVVIEGFDDGVNIVAAANETGKSTLIRAIARALFDRHTCKDQEIRSLQPVGTDLSPKIEVEFSTVRGRFRIAKSFLNSPKSILQEWVDKGWHSIAEGDQADQRVRELLDSSQPSRGATSAAHWGLMGYLWAPQGEVVQWPEWDSIAGEMIRSRLVRVTLDPLVDRLRDRLWEDYQRHFTAKGQVRKGGALQLAQQERTDSQVALEGVRSQLRDLDERRQRFRSLGEEQVRLKQELDEIRENAVASQRDAHQAELLTRELAGLRAEFKAAQSALSQIRTDAEHLAETEKRCREVQERLNQLSVAVKEMEGQLKLQQAEFIRIEQQRDKTAKEAKNLGRELEKVRQLATWRRLSIEAEDLERLMNQATHLGETVVASEEQLARTPQVKPKQLAKLEALASEANELRIRLESLGLEVTLETDRDASVTVQRESEEETLELSSGESIRVTAPDSMQLNLKQWGRLHIRSGAVEVSELAQQLQSVEQDYQKLLEKLTADSLDEARFFVAQRQEAKASVKSAEEALQGLLNHFESVSSIREALTKNGKRRAQLEEELGGAACEASLHLAELDAREVELKTKLEHVESEVETAHEAMRQEKNRSEKHTKSFTKTKEEASELRAELRHLEALQRQYKERFPEGVKAEQERLQMVFVAAEARLQAKEKDLPGDPDKLAARNRRASAALAALESRLAAGKAEQERLRGQLEAMGSQGLYSRETELLERLERAQRREQQSRSAGWAARLAHDLIERRKSEATRAVLAPLEDRLSGTFAEITGETARRVYLDESLQIKGVGRNEDSVVPFRLLSQGAKEQLLMSLRLAIAGELAQSEAQTLILDDVLVNTDRGRQDRILDYLTTLDRSIQVIILTCHPEWYRGSGRTLTIG